MLTFNPRTRGATLKLAIAVIAVASTGPALSEEAKPAPATPAESGSTAPLTMAEAVSLALHNQPLLQAQQGAVNAANENAVAAAQLPDPKLSVGLSSLTLTGEDAFTLRDEGDTQFTFGVMQDLPRAGKRELRGRRGQLAAQVSAEELDTMQAAVHRDVELAWLEVYLPERAAELMRASQREAESQADAADIAYRAGKITQADLIAARVEVDRVREEIAGKVQDTAHARSMLSRWIGTQADRPLPEQLASQATPATAGVILEHMRRHPHLDSLNRQVEIAQADVDLAKQAYKPDVSVGASYGLRPAFPDYLSLEFQMELPYFTANRQDRALAASLAELDRAKATKEDVWRQHEAELRLNYADWQQLQPRLARFDRDILPQARARVEAARLAFESGRGDLNSILIARRSLLEMQMQRLELQVDEARHLVQLDYLSSHARGKEVGHE